MPYSFDPELVPIVEFLPTVNDARADPAAIAAGRIEAGTGALFGQDEPDRPGVSKEDRSIAGRPGDADVSVRIYRPNPLPDTSVPALLYIHGGGYTSGSVEWTDGICQEFCGELELVVVSVEYRLAPEHPYPAALHDCLAAFEWLHVSCTELGVDRDRIGVGGGSAGGGLAAAVALHVRDNDGPRICFQYLHIPTLDDRLETSSMRRFTDTPLWNRPNAEWSWRHYLGALYGRADVPYTAAPARCADLHGLPSAYISTMEFDPLRDEGIHYGLALLEAGVQVELHSFPGTFHGSSLFGTAAVSRREGQEALEVLRRGLGAPSPRKD